MSHRNSNPKPHARERTMRRWRDRHNYSTKADEAHTSLVQEVKDKIYEWRHPEKKEELVVQVN